MVYSWPNNVRNWFFPSYCSVCCTPTQAGRLVCAACHGELPWLQESEERIHAHLPVLDSCQALFDYRPPVDRWICELKFNQELGRAKLLGYLLAECVPDGGNSKLVPVPLHQRRLRQRGFNQALEIARPLQQRGYKIDERCCTRTRHTPPQSELAAAARRRNLRNAFGVEGDIAGTNIVLIDDVFTTGATLNALATVLKRAGAVRIDAWVVARTPEPGTSR